MEVINRKFSQHIPVVAICQYDEDIAKILRFLLREEFKDIRISIYDRSEFLIKIVNSSYNMLIIDDDSRREDRKIVLAARKILPHAFIVSSLVMLRQDDIREAYRHGADRVLIKPSPFENLTNFVREAYKLE